jgi:uncharacterized membrane protein YhiD involved in acid resistance
MIEIIVGIAIGLGIYFIYGLVIAIMILPAVLILRWLLK